MVKDLDRWMIKIRITASQSDKWIRNPKYYGHKKFSTYTMVMYVITIPN